MALFQVLSGSPLLQTFSDHLWSVVKTAHERDLLAVIHEHRKAKVAYSGRFPGKLYPVALTSSGTLGRLHMIHRTPVIA